MQTPDRSWHSTREEGFALVTAVVMLAIAGVTAGSILTAALTYRSTSEANYRRDEAAFLADAGLRATHVKLNAYLANASLAAVLANPTQGNISTNQSRGYFSQTGGLTASDWGFSTQVGVTNTDNLLIVSTGRYQSVTVRAEVILKPGFGDIHSLYAHALYAGNSSSNATYVLKIGGTGTGADFVRGDTYSGRNIEVSGTAALRLPESLARDVNGDGVYSYGTDTWNSAYATQTFWSALSQSAFNTYSNAMRTNMSKVYNNGKYDYGEAFVDTIGNGVYDVGEPFVDANTNGIWDRADSFIDRNSNGVYNAGVDTVVDRGNGRYDAGEEWTEDRDHRYQNKTNGALVRVNGKYDKAGGYYNGSTWTSNSYTKAWPAEQFEDVGDGVYNPAESYTDQNGVYDVGEKYIDDRNSVYDYGTHAPGTITGMPSTPGPGQKTATGGDRAVTPPDLQHMYYSLPKSDTAPTNALSRWGSDVTVTASNYTGNGHVVADSSKPEHIFVRNVLESAPGGPNGQYTTNWGGVTIKSRGYTRVYDSSSNRVDDYFLEDPTDSTYNTIPGESLAVAKNDSDHTHTMLIDVEPEQNNKTYYVDGNVYLHATPTYALRFRNPGTRITIVAKGNITVSDEFYYNAAYDPNLQYSAMNSRVVNNPSDALCLIALKNPACTNSGNIYIGDPAMNTGGSIHAMLYAENDFVDININSVDQQFISVFGNMTAGNMVRINRDVGSGQYRTRLDVTLDERIRDHTIVAPGLPHPVGSEDGIWDTAWHIVPGSWASWSMLK